MSIESMIPGNRNAWKHGRYSRAVIEERRARMSEVREMRLGGDVKAEVTIRS